MGITWFETEEEMDDEAQRFEELQFDHLALKEAVADRQKDLEDANEELRIFEEEYSEYLLAP